MQFLRNCAHVEMSDRMIRGTEGARDDPEREGTRGHNNAEIL